MTTTDDTTDTTTTDATTTTEPPPEVDVEPKPGSEAARYRVRAVQAEGERDALIDRVAALQTVEVHRQATGRLAVPGDVFNFGLALADVLDTDGNLDDGLVETAIVGLLSQRPGLAHVHPVSRDLGQGQRTPVDTGASWSSVLKKG